MSDGAVNYSYCQSPVLWHEGEKYAAVPRGIGEVVSKKAPASQGKALTGGALGEKGHQVIYRLTLPQAIADAKIVFRYARYCWKKEMKTAIIICRVTSHNASYTKTMTFADTKGWGTHNGSEWSISAVGLGDLGKGPLTVVLTSASKESDVVLDGFFIAPAHMTFSAKEFSGLNRVAITSQGYLGIAAPSATVDQFNFKGLGVAGRGFVPGTETINVLLKNKAGKTFKVFYKNTPFRLSDQVSCLNLTAGEVKTIPDGNYTLEVSWDNGASALLLPLTVLGELLNISEKQIQKINAYRKKLTGNTSASVKVDLEYLAEYTGHVLVTLRSRAGLKQSAKLVAAAAQYFSRNGQYQNTPAAMFANDLRGIIWQSNAMMENVKNKKPAYQGLCGSLRRAFRSKASGKLEPFQFYLPAARQAAKKIPLLLRLAGNENMFQDADNGVSVALLEKKGYLVVAPKANSGYYGAGQKDLVQLIRLMLDEYPQVDRKRIYSTGASGGGFASYDLAVEYPHLITGIACVNGSAWKTRKKAYKQLPHSLKKVQNLKNVKVLLIQGDVDRIVDKEHADFLARELKRRGYTYKYRVLKGYGHHIPSEKYMKMTLEYFDKQTSVKQEAKKV